MRLTHWFREAAFVLTGCPEITWVESRLRAPTAEIPGCGPTPTLESTATVAVPLEFQSVVSFTAWPHWPMVYTAA